MKKMKTLNEKKGSYKISMSKYKGSIKTWSHRKANWINNADNCRSGKRILNNNETQSNS